MARLDYYLGSWSLTALVIPEVRYDKNPPFGSDFYPDVTVSDAELLPLIDFVPDLPPAADPLDFVSGEALVIQQIRENRADHWRTPLASEDPPEWGAVLTGIFHGWDVSFYAAQYYANRGRVALVPGLQEFELAPDLPGVDPVDVVVDFITELQFDWRTMLGVGANYTLGSWLLKAELAYIDGFNFDVLREGDLILDSTIPPFDKLYLFATPDEIEKSRFDTMAGVEYYGLTNTNIALEVVNRHIRDFDEVLRAFPNYAKENALETALRITLNLMREKLEVTLLGIVFAEPTRTAPWNWPYDGSIARIEADYEVRDALTVGGGVVLYQSGDRPLVGLTQVGRNDRLFLRLKYSF
jgi:hypothetical protein